MTGNDKDLPREAIAALERGSKIEAIKCVRVARGVGLKDAKEVIEDYLDRSPRVSGRMAAANAERARSSLGWFALVAALAALAYYFLGGQA
ncbi:ribosomal protein L7/L12 [Candidatus Accumulibacter sp. ACC003]|uniref:ribosomal protein L7/L12 n=1 Tax=Candidatus Accumulibacter sp. ACC003 TaxID=2823334 RepID=UPI0025BBEB7B|nr:ribosomal protein L7/L12 [Candidatus Accumulibacter sp. ACC003]